MWEQYQQLCMPLQENVLDLKDDVTRQLLRALYGRKDGRVQYQPGTINVVPSWLGELVRFC